MIFTTYVSLSHQPRYALGSSRLEIRFCRLLSHQGTIEGCTYLYCLYSVEMLNVILGPIVKLGTLWPQSWLRCQRNSMWLGCFRCDFTFPDKSVFHSYSVEVSNSFNLLAGPMFNDSVFSNTSVSPQFLPQSHCSPHPPGGILPALSRTSTNSQVQRRCPAWYQRDHITCFPSKKRRICVFIN